MSGAGSSSGATGATMTALNIFMKMCREEHQEMFPEEQLGTLITSLHLLHIFRFNIGGYGDKKGFVLCALRHQSSFQMMTSSQRNVQSGGKRWRRRRKDGLFFWKSREESPSPKCGPRRPSHLLCRELRQLKLKLQRKPRHLSGKVSNQVREFPIWERDSHPEVWGRSRKQWFRWLLWRMSSCQHCNQVIMNPTHSEFCERVM